MQPIKHIWFDFSNTIVEFDEQVHDQIVHETYAAIVGKPITPELKAAFAALREQHGSYSATFTALGKDSTFWSDHISSMDPKIWMRLTDPDSPAVFRQLKEIVPISIWSNVRVGPLLPAFDIDPQWFTHILGPDEVKNPKPALDGFHLVIERSGLPPGEILFVGDSLRKEILPAKSLGIQAGLIWDVAPEADYCFQGFREILDLVQP